MAAYVVQLDKSKSNDFTVPEMEHLRGGALSWDGTGGVEGDKAYFQVKLDTVVIYNKAIPFKSGESLDMPDLSTLKGVVSFTADKDGTTLLIFTKSF